MKIRSASLASLAIVTAVLACGCSSSSNSGGGGGSNSTVTGKLGGQTAFSVGTGLGGSGTISTGTSGSGTGYVVEVILSSADVPNACSAVNSNIQLASAQDLFVGAQSLSAVVTGQAYTVGTASATATSVGVGQYNATNSTCVSTTQESATGGTVTFSTINATTIAGTYSLTFASGDSVTGSFDVPVCATLLTNTGSSSNDAGAATCTTN